MTRPILVVVLAFSPVLPAFDAPVSAGHGPLVFIGTIPLWSPSSQDPFPTPYLGKTRHTNPICWKEPRIYHPGGAEAVEIESEAARVLRVRHLVAPLGQPRMVSANGAYAFQYSEDPIVGGPSGSSRVSLRVFKEADYLLSVEAEGVQAMRDIAWVNDKLLYFRLWLGRLAGADVLLDVEEERVVRMEAFRDGMILWQEARESCQAAPQLFPACSETCTTLR